MGKRTVYTIEELAERTGIDRETLERWTEMGLLRGGTASSGTAFFGAGVAARAEHIRKLIDLGYEEADVGKILRKIGLPEEARDEPEIGQREKLLTVGALAEGAGVSARTIKHWEDKGIIEPDARSEGGFRLYRDYYVYLCQLIQDLQHFGYSLDDIKRISDYFRDFDRMRNELDPYPPGEAEERLGEMVSEIDRLFDTMKRLRSGIDRWEKLLNKHKKLVADLRRANEKRS
ncbi:MAG: MerR family transcriptional regulator [Spirochaetota bacterium]